jgi:hypothetical protein
MRRVLPALLIVVAANAAMLVGVAASRSGDPDAVITMTERELPMRFTTDRDSARQLEIRADQAATIFLPWLGRQKLQALGFDVDALPKDNAAGAYSRQLPRRVFVVLEYDGPAWQDYLTDLRRRHAVMEQQEDEVRRGVRVQSQVTEPYVPAPKDVEEATSRLMAIDAGTDAAALRRTYPDRRRHIIAPATVRLQYDFRPVAERITGSISLVTHSLVVPRQWRAVLDSLGSGSPYGGTKTPRYTVTVSYGSRHEPWITAIERIDTLLAPH